MSGLNGFHAPTCSRFNYEEWQELKRCAAGEIPPGAVASLLKRVVSGFEYMDTEQLRQRCYELVELHQDWGI